MPAYKDENGNGWFCQFYYENWQGKKERVKKRGFKTKREALAWEAEFKMMANASMDMTLSNFVEVYFRDKEGELKDRSVESKRYMIDAHIIPYFGDRPMNTITPSDLIRWQNKIREKGFSPTYLRMIQNQITALFTRASVIYNLVNNPCKKVKKMGKPDADKRKYVDRMYGLSDSERMFPVGAEAVQHAIKRYAEKAGVKRIKVHDLRHSHVAYMDGNAHESFESF